MSSKSCCRQYRIQFLRVGIPLALRVQFLCALLRKSKSGQSCHRLVSDLREFCGAAVSRSLLAVLIASSDRADEGIQCHVINTVFHKGLVCLIFSGCICHDAVLLVGLLICLLDRKSTHIRKRRLIVAQFIRLLGTVEAQGISEQIRSHQHKCEERRRHDHNQHHWLFRKRRCIVRLLRLLRLLGFLCFFLCLRLLRLCLLLRLLFLLLRLLLCFFLLCLRFLLFF